MRRRLAHTISITVLAVTCFPLVLCGQNALICDELQLDRAESQYQIGLFADALKTLSPCLRDDAPTGLRSSALRLAALSYIATDQLDQAGDAVDRLLSVDPNFQPDSDGDNLVFRDMVNDRKPPWYTWVWTGEKWYHWAGRVALAGALVAIPVALINEEPPDLPEAPADPL